MQPTYIMHNQLMIPPGKRRGRPPKQQVVVPTPDQLKYRTADTSSLAAMGAPTGITISPGQLITSSGPMPTGTTVSGGSGVSSAGPGGQHLARSSSPGGLIGGPTPLGAGNGASFLPQQGPRYVHLAASASSMD